MARTKTAERQQVKFTSKDFVKQNSNPTPVDSADLRLFCNAHGFQEMSDEEEPVPLRDWFIVQTADRTLDNNANEQKIFNTVTDGKCTLEVGYYDFYMNLQVTGMSGTSGNAKFALLGAGTCVLDWAWNHVIGNDSASGAAITMNGSINAGQASGFPMVTAAIQTELKATIWGSFAVSTAGTLIPSITLQHAAAATIKKGTMFRLKKLNGFNSGGYFGPWS